MNDYLLFALPLLLGYSLDLLLGDPESWPHPVRLYGNAIAKGEKLLNNGPNRFIKGAAFTVALCALTFAIFFGMQSALFSIHVYLGVAFTGIMVFYGLANQGLVSEGKKVFEVLERQGLEAGRKQLSRIVGRDTEQLSAHQVRIGALESMSENLSDGVIAPLFWYALGGMPAMMTYKMVNTLDSMIGYHNERYEQFGKFAARLDDVANWVPARITPLLMALASLKWRGLIFAYQFGSQHKSPNSGYPEAALAGILDCRFGGPNQYKGQWVHKPYIGQNERTIVASEINLVARINHLSCLIMVVCILLLHFYWHR